MTKLMIMQDPRHDFKSGGKCKHALELMYYTTRGLGCVVGCPVGGGSEQYFSVF